MNTKNSKLWVRREDGQTDRYNFYVVCQFESPVYLLCIICTTKSVRSRLLRIPSVLQ
jgi:hypothetical protein